MRTLFIVIIVFLSVLSISAQDTIRSFYPTTPKTIQSWHEVKLYNGSKLNHGEFRVLYISGTVKEQGAYSLGQLHGNYKVFLEDGTLNFTCRYTNGILNGEHKTYYTSGNLKERKLYINGKVQGNYKFYADIKDSEPTKIEKYKMGKKLN